MVFPSQRCDLVIDEAEAEIVRLIFHKYVYEGYGAQKLSHYLYEQGVVGRNNKNIPNTSIVRMIKNKGYTGYLINGAVETECPQLRIIEPELFEQAQELRQLDDLKAETILVIRGVSALDKELLGTLVAEAKDALETLEKQLVQAQDEYEEATKTAKRSNYICNELFTWADVYDTANHDERRAILQQFIKEIRVRKDYEISITLNASFNQVEQLKSVSTYDGAEIFEEISEKGA